MKRIAVLFFAGAIVVVMFVVVVIKLKASKNTSYKDAPAFTILKLDGTAVEFNRTNYPRRLIFNFFGTGCEFCVAEMSEIVLFSRKHKVEVVFASADPLDSIRSYAAILRKQGLDDNRISFVQIALADAERLLGSLEVPQTVVFLSNLKIRRIKKGIVSFDYLENAIE